MSTASSQSCDPLLSLVFSRYPNTKFAIETDLNAPPVLWDVIGRFDLLKITSHSNLDEVIAFDRKKQSTKNQNATSGVVLVPFPGFETDVLEHAQSRENYLTFLGSVCTHRCDRSKNEVFESTSRNYPFLYIVQFVISPAAHQISKNAGGVLKVFETVRNVLSQRFADYSSNLRPPDREPHGDTKLDDQLFFFRSLGASDIAVVALPRTEIRLCELIRFFRATRRLLLVDIFPDEKPPGHAFALVEDSVAYRGTAPELSPDSSVLKLHTDVMVDCGHENEIVTFTPDTVSVESLTGLHTLRLTHSNVQSFMTHWAPKVASQDFRTATLIDSTSTISVTKPAKTGAPESSDPLETIFKDDSTKSRRAWELSRNLTDLLEDIRKAIEGWAKIIMLPPEQERELLSLVHTFATSFSRLETAMALRDLLPFMMQLAACCGRYTDWQKFWSQNETRTDQVRDDTTMLILHLAQAFQNRLEPRSQHADPTIFRTLEHGASKVVPAYSTLYWLSGKVFRDESAPAGNTPADILCNADPCGVCVAIGSAGHVRFEEIFADFREYLTHERSKVRPKETRDESHDRKYGDWTKPLILLDASGHQLLQPELSTINSFHETVLFSNWLLGKKQESLRRSTIDILCKFIWYLVTVELGVAQFPIGEGTKSALIILRFLIIQNHLKKDSQLDKFDNQILPSLDPRRILSDLADSVVDLATNDVFNLITRTRQEYFTDITDSLTAQHGNIDTVLKSFMKLRPAKFRHLQQLIREAQLTANEIIADTAKLAVSERIIANLSRPLSGISTHVMSTLISTKAGQQLQAGFDLVQLKNRQTAIASMLSSVEEKVRARLTQDPADNASTTPDENSSRTEGIVTPVLGLMSGPLSDWWFNIRTTEHSLPSLGTVERSLLEHFADALTLRLSADTASAPGETLPPRTDKTSGSKATAEDKFDLIRLTLSRVEFILCLWQQSLHLGGVEVFTEFNAANVQPSGQSQTQQ